MGKFLWRLFLIALAVLVLWVGYLFISGQQVNVLGYAIVKVEGTDMDPTLSEGSLLIVRQLTESLRVKKGDIITYRRQDAEQTVTSRVLELSIGQDGTERYHVQGDNPLAAPDAEPVRRGEIIGVYWQKIK